MKKKMKKNPDPPTSPSQISLNGFCGRKAQCFLFVAYQITTGLRYEAPLMVGLDPSCSTELGHKTAFVHSTPVASGCLFEVTTQTLFVTVSCDTVILSKHQGQRGGT